MFIASLITVCLIFTAYIIWLEDSLLEIQYTEFHDYWLVDGCPRGIFYVPKGSSVSNSWLMAFRSWESRYDWTKGHPKAEKLVKRLIKLRKPYLYYLLTQPFIILIFKIFIGFSS